MNFCSIVDNICGHKKVWWIKNLYKKKKSHTGNNLSSDSTYRLYHKQFCTQNVTSEFNGYNI
jgi:hypothetical protein